MMELTLSRLDYIRLLKKLDDRKRDEVIKRSLFQSTLFLTKWIKDKRLSGPRPEFLGVVTGWLRASITGNRTEKLGNTYQAKVGTNVEYGPKHEFGINTRKRPFLRPAIEDKENQEKVLYNLRRNINEQLES